MVVFNIDVKIKEQGNKAVQSGLKQLQKTADRTQKEVQGIGKTIKTDKLKQFNSELRKTGKIAQQTRRIMTQLFGAIGIGIAIREVAQLSDTYTNFQNRLKIVTNGTQDLADTTEELFAIANETRSAYSSTAELFTRVSIATKNLGRTQKEVIQFTKTLNKAVILSGTTAAEAKNGIIQLSQGMASGALRGDELRSVLEQLPKVADAIATSMNITRGELRKMGEAGKISADVMINAMLKASKTIDKEFAETIPTISQAFEVLGNSFIKTIGEFNESTRAAEGFAKAVIAVAPHIGKITIALGLLALGFVSVKVQARLAGLSMAGFAVKAKAAVLAFNPMLLLAIAAGTAIGFMTNALTSSTSEVERFETAAERMTSLDKLKVTIRLANKELINMRLALANGRKETKSFIDRMEKLDAAVTKGTREIKLREAGLWELTKAQERHAKAIDLSKAGLKEQLRLAFLSSRAREIEIATLKEVARVEVAGGGKVTESQKNSIKLRVMAVRTAQEYTAAVTALTAKEDERLRKLRELDLIEKNQPQLADQIAAARERLNAVPVKELTPPGFNEGLQVAIQHMQALQRQAVATGERGAEALEGKLHASLVKNAEGAKTLREGVQRIKDTVAGIGGSAEQADAAIKELLGPTESEEFFQQLDDLNLKLEQGRISAFNYRAQVREIGPEGQKSATTFGDGFTKAFNRMRDEANDLKKVGEELVTLFADKAVEAISTLATEGSLNFKAFAADVLKQIARIIIRLLVVKALSTLGDAYTGGAASAVTTAANAGIDASQETEARADGGPIEAGRPYLVGEEGPELVVPRNAGTVIPNGALGAQAAPPPPPEVNVSVVNVTDPNELPSAVDGGDYDQNFVNLIARNGDQVRQAIQQS